MKTSKLCRTLKFINGKHQQKLQRPMTKKNQLQTLAGTRMTNDMYHASKVNCEFCLKSSPKPGKIRRIQRSSATQAERSAWYHNTQPQVTNSDHCLLIMKASRKKLANSFVIAFFCGTKNFKNHQNLRVPKTHFRCKKFIRLRAIYDLQQTARENSKNYPEIPTTVTTDFCLDYSVYWINQPK